MLFRSGDEIKKSGSLATASPKTGKSTENDLLNGPQLPGAGATQEEIDALLAKPVQISADDKARMTSLREEAEKLHRDGKTADALNALTKARAIIHKAQDAELLGKSDG